MGKSSAGILDAYTYGPDRAEPLYRIAVYYREQKGFPLAQLFMERARTIPCPRDSIFVEKAVYDYLIPFEYAVCCYWSGQHAEAIRINNQILATPGVAPDIFHQALLNRRYSMDAVYPKKPVALSRTNRFKVLVPFHNPGTSFDNCIASLLEQDHGNFELIFLDNASTDESVQWVPADDPRVSLIRCQQELTRLQMIHDVITRYCQPDDIMVTVDGADWLANRQVLSKLNHLYNAYDCWVLYGQYGEANGSYGCAQPYPDETALQEPGHSRFPHLLQSFRASLYLDIQAQNPEALFRTDRSAMHTRNEAQEPHQDHKDSRGGITSPQTTVSRIGASSWKGSSGQCHDLAKFDDGGLMRALVRTGGV